MVAFLLNGFIFIVIGLQLPGILHELSHEPFSRLVGYGLLISATVVLVRVAWVFPATYLPRWLSPEIARSAIPPRPGDTASSSPGPGMRGVVSLAAAFALPLVPSTAAALPGSQLHPFSDLLRHPNDSGFPRTNPAAADQENSASTTTERSTSEERQARLRANEAAVDFIEATSARTTHARRRDGAGARGILRPHRPARQPAPATRKTLAAKSPRRSTSNCNTGALGVERKTIIALRDSRQINDEAPSAISSAISTSRKRG